MINVLRSIHTEILIRIRIVLSPQNSHFNHNPRWCMVKMFCSSTSGLMVSLPHQVIVLSDQQCSPYISDHLLSSMARGRGKKQKWLVGCSLSAHSRQPLFLKSQISSSLTVIQHKVSTLEEPLGPGIQGPYTKFSSKSDRAKLSSPIPMEAQGHRKR
jgi:hypothetical protein